MSNINPANIPVKIFNTTESGKVFTKSGEEVGHLWNNEPDAVTISMKSPELFELGDAVLVRDFDETKTKGFITDKDLSLSSKELKEMFNIKGFVAGSDLAEKGYMVMLKEPRGNFKLFDFTGDGKIAWENSDGTEAKIYTLDYIKVASGTPVAVVMNEALKVADKEAGKTVSSPSVKVFNTTESGSVYTEKGDEVGHLWNNNPEALTLSYKSPGLFELDDVVLVRDATDADYKGTITDKDVDKSAKELQEMMKTSGVIEAKDLAEKGYMAMLKKTNGNFQIFDFTGDGKIGWKTKEGNTVRLNTLNYIICASGNPQARVMSEIIE
ncbi:MAG: hypothetical protein ABRQ39_17575 [Candidatus Eremiobacterota bacterium]